MKYLGMGPPSNHSRQKRPFLYFSWKVKTSELRHMNSAYSYCPAIVSSDDGFDKQLYATR